MTQHATQLASTSDTTISDDTLRAIAAKASFLRERLNLAPAVNCDQSSVEEMRAQRLRRWSEIVGQGDAEILRKRLAWAEMDFDAVYACLDVATSSLAAELPAWTRMIREIVAQSADPAIWTAQSNFDPANPIPFEDIVWPAVYVARQRLWAQCNSRSGAVQALSPDLLSSASMQSLEVSLLQRLSGISSQVLEHEFGNDRPFGRGLLNLVSDSEQGASTKRYKAFVQRLRGTGLANLFLDYPVLARLIAVAVEHWVQASAEFLERLAQDKAQLQIAFGARAARPLGNIVELSASLSDSHNGGRTVISLRFENGIKLVYKPKDVAPEAFFNDLLHWANERSSLLDFKVTQVLERDGYGWVEFVEHLPCANEAEVQEFYERAGMLLALLYALRATDCHYENIIANGAYPVLIDMETLLHHEPKLIDDSALAQEIEAAAAQQLWDSVLRTGLLPRWQFGADVAVAYDISGLGRTETRHVARKMARWQYINTDDMRLQYQEAMPLDDKNAPRLRQRALDPSHYRAQLVGGFRSMYRFLMRERETLLTSNGPLARMHSQRVRFIFRPTRIYGRIQTRSLSPDSLCDGANFSIELDHLSRAFVVANARPSAFPILDVELRAMEQLDVPYFEASATDSGLAVGSIAAIADYFKRPSFDDALQQIQALNDDDLARQIAIIHGSYDAKIASIASRPGGRWTAQHLAALSSERCIEEALTIASDLESRAIADGDGSLNWIGLDYLPQAERFQLQALGQSLADGRAGVALFFSALSHVTSDPRYARLALRTFQPLRRQIHALDENGRGRFARAYGIGGVSGLASMCYSLTKCARWLDDESLLKDASTLSGWITSQRIAEDRQLDVISGAAGAILGLLPLYAATNDLHILNTALDCADHLIAHQQSAASSARAWQTQWDKPLTGFSHGAAGISYALLRLHAVTNKKALHDAALQGIEYERSVFSAADQNWPDFRRNAHAAQHECATKWCHGASGIGLARVGCMPLTDDLQITREIEIALQTTATFDLHAIDHLCCGNLGRVEVLLVAGQRCAREDWTQVACLNAANVVARAREHGAYQLFPNLPTSVFNPGFFAGTAGIGYQLLRLARNDLPCVLLWE